jgi:hypothetical protein
VQSNGYRPRVSTRELGCRRRSNNALHRSPSFNAAITVLPGTHALHRSPSLNAAITVLPCSPVAGHAHATAGYAHLAARAGTRELEGRSSQRTAARRPRSALGPRVPARVPRLLRRTWQGARALARVRMLALHVRSLRLQARVAQRAGVDLRHDELGGRLEEGLVVARHCATAPTTTTR